MENYKKLKLKIKKSLNTRIPYVNEEAKTVFFAYDRTSSIYKVDFVDL